MPSGKKVLLIGPGFIGLNVLNLLVAEGYEVTGLFRRQEHGEEIKKSGAITLQGDLDDHDLIAKHSAESDITIHTATADHLPSAKAVLDGVKQRTSQGKMAIYIHTSGTSLLADDANGNYKSDKIFYDNKPEDIDALPDSAPHRFVDKEIVATAKEVGEKAKIAIIIPPEIYGFNPEHKRLSIQTPTLARFAMKHGWPGHVGKGLSVWSKVHVLDLARGYMALLHHLEGASPKEIVQNPYWFCENGKEYSWKEVAENIGQILKNKGLLKDANPREIPRELWDDLFGGVTGIVLGCNSRSRAVRLRELGWEPKEKSIWESLEQDELPEILQEEG